MGARSKKGKKPASVASQDKLLGQVDIEALPEVSDSLSTSVEDSEKHKKIEQIYYRHRVVTVPLLLLFGLLIFVGYSYTNNTIENRDIVHRISEIKVDSFSTETVDQYLASGADTKIKTMIQKIDQQPIVITVGANQVKPAPSDIDKWLNLVTNDTKGTANVTVIDANVLSYFNYVSAQNNQTESDQVVVSHANGTSAVLFRGVDGIKVNGMQAASDQVSSQLLDGKGVNVNLPVVTTPFATTSTIPPQKIMEVDLTQKVMYIYQGGNLINTFLASAGAPSTPTPTGTFHIYEKLLSQNMSGFNVNGTPYFQPNVPYVNYFYEADAVHGNYWRPASYFGNINSSHGCVGLEVANAEWVYNWAPIGTTVIVHD